MQDDKQLQGLQALLAADGALVERVQASGNAETAAQLLCDAAARQGMTVDPTALLEHAQQQVIGQANGALSDSQLESIAGGADPTMKYGEFVGLSAGTAMLGCVIASASGVITDVPYQQKGQSWMLQLCKRSFDDSPWLTPR